MAWIESHQTLREHPKLTALARNLNIHKAQAIGHLHMLWWWCIDYADDGLLDRYSEAQICEAAGFQGDFSEKVPQIIKALINAKFLDSRPLRVHDWLDFCGDLVKKRLEYRKAKRRRTKRLGDSLRKTENSQRTSRTVPAIPKSTPVLMFDFEVVYNQYPNKDSRKGAERHFRTSVIFQQDFLDIQKALLNYIQHLKSENWKQPQSAKTWFNNWRDWVNYGGTQLPKDPPPAPLTTAEKELSEDDRKEVLDLLSKAKSKAIPHA